MDYSFTVSSSDGTNNYHVSVKVSKNSIKAFCTCAAGIQNQVCRHKNSILIGDKSALESEYDISEFNKLQKILSDHPVFEKISNLINRLAELEKEKSSIDKEFKATKAQFARKLDTGNWDF